jgi:hypothetical protein
LLSSSNQQQSTAINSVQAAFKQRSSSNQQQSVAFKQHSSSNQQQSVAFKQRLSNGSTGSSARAVGCVSVTYHKIKKNLYICILYDMLMLWQKTQLAQDCL